jgi:rRNA maturation RNase YbeY
VIVNRQNEVEISLPPIRAFVRKLKLLTSRQDQEFDVAFVSDAEIERLNAAFRAKQGATDVLSFQWGDPQDNVPEKEGKPRSVVSHRSPLIGTAPLGETRRLNRSGKPGRSRKGPEEFTKFLGDIVISAATARRNAAAEGHSTTTEIRWLIVHGFLHLLGYDHETDHGEMEALELTLRRKMGISGERLTRIRKDS